jgi:trehalose synthase-fused probable maltokinase
MANVAVDPRRLDAEALADWMAQRRWFGSKSRELAQVHVLDAVPLHDGPPSLSVAIVEARFPGGTHDLYQLPFAARAAAEGWAEAVVQELDGQTVYDALADPDAVAHLSALLREQASMGDTSRVAFHWLATVPPPTGIPPGRPIGAEQSNSSVVLDERLVLKLFRRLEPGESPELEMVRFLSAHGFPHIAELGGWSDYSGEVMDATLTICQRMIAGGRDGWELVLDGLAEDPDGLLERLRDLGAVLGAMHAVLASDPSDPAFAPEEPSEEALPLLVATIDEQIERLFVDLPRDDERLAAIAGRGEEARDRLKLAAAAGSLGRLIRHHGDFHLGQTLLVPERNRWVLLDFEGEPARPLRERRRKGTALRDVAGLLRSLAYAVFAAQLQRGVLVSDGWEQRAREAFLQGYGAAVDPTVLPPSEAATSTLLSILELEKAVYELRYELDHRPDWVPIPAAVIERLLNEDAAA